MAYDEDMAELIKAHMAAIQRIEDEATRAVSNTAALGNQLIWLTATMGPDVFRNQPQLTAQVLEQLGGPLKLLETKNETPDNPSDSAPAGGPVDPGDQPSP